MSVDPKVYAFAARHDCEAEIAVLLRLAQGDAEGAAAGLARVDPAVLIDVARLNKVLHLLWRNRPLLQGALPALLPPLDRFRLRTIAMNRLCLAESARLAGALRRAGLAHVQFKGPLQQLALHGDAFLKPTADIDILVRSADRPRAARLLEAAGYRPQEAALSSWWTGHLGEEHYARPGEAPGAAPGAGPVVDLHHRLQQPGTPGMRDEGRFIDAAAQLTVEGEEVPVPSPSHVCLVIAANLGKALVARDPCLSHALDLRAALDRLSPAAAAGLQRLARAHGMSGTLAFATRAADALFPPPGGPRPAAGAAPLGPLTDATLTAMITRPWDRRIEWPRRRRILWALCGGAPLRFLAEARRALRSDLHRRALEARMRGGATR